MIHSSLGNAALASLASLRPPFARPATLLYPFSLEGSVNPGVTVQLPDGEPAVAPGTGTVIQVWSEVIRFYTTDTLTSNGTVVNVLIDHGAEVFSLLSGLASANVISGQTVTRGDLVGPTKNNQLFYGIRITGKFYDPLSINQHFRVQDGLLAFGQTNKIRYAPDRLLRDLSNGITAILSAGIRYFTPAPPFLINIAFNGPMAGQAFTGIGSSDFWNTYTPVAFQSTPASSYCGTGGQLLSANLIVPLSNYLNQPSPVLLERLAPLDPTAGTGSSWSPLLSSWIGGLNGSNVPYINAFILRGMAAGSYNLYLYGDSFQVGMTTAYFSVAVNGAAPTVVHTAPTAVMNWVSLGNYVLFPLTLSSKSVVAFTASGKLSGLQLQRTG